MGIIQIRGRARRFRSGQRGRRNILWVFVNSSFGLWFLSAIFLSGTGASYAVWQQRLADNRATRNTIERLDMEISYRLYSILTVLKRHQQMRDEIQTFATVAKGVRSGDVIVVPSDFRMDTTGISEKRRVLNRLQELAGEMRGKVSRALHSERLLLDPPQGEYSSLLPEFSTVGLPALVVMLRGRVEERERSELDGVFKALSEITARRDEEEVALIVRDRIALTRWRGMLKTYYECSNDDPLCMRDSRQGFSNLVGVSIDDTTGMIGVMRRDDLAQALKEASDDSKHPSSNIIAPNSH